MIVEHYGQTMSLLSSFIDKLSHDELRLNVVPTRRVGIINWWWLSDNEASLDNLKAFVERQDICFFLSEEIFQRYQHINVNDVFALLNRYNVYYVLFSEDHNLSVKPNYSKSFYCPWFFKSPLHVSADFAPDSVYREKPYAFNLMLGSRKHFRTLSYKVLKNNNNIYASYLGHSKFKDTSMTFLDDADIKSNLVIQNVDIDKLNTMDTVLRNNSNHAISHVVPETIYAKTHFDIVTETFVKPGHHFLTEKTAKPLATGRFFCWYASSGVKSYLEKYGFAFESEFTSYDRAINDVDRLDILLDMVEEIASNQNLVKEIYTKTAASRKHNMDVYWKSRERFDLDLCDWLLLCLNT
jgi:hypothetical protein